MIRGWSEGVAREVEVNGSLPVLLNAASLLLRLSARHDAALHYCTVPRQSPVTIHRSAAIHPPTSKCSLTCCPLCSIDATPLAAQPLRPASPPRWRPPLLVLSALPAAAATASSSLTAACVLPLLVVHRVLLPVFLPLFAVSVRQLRPSSTPSSSCLSLSQRYNLKVREAKAAYQSNRLQLALTSYQAAYDLISSDAKLKHRIESLQHRLTADGAAAPPALNTHHSSASPPLPAPPSPLRLERVDDLFDRDPAAGSCTSASPLRRRRRARKDGQRTPSLTRLGTGCPLPSTLDCTAIRERACTGHTHWHTSHAVPTHCTTTPRAPAHSLNSTVHRPLLA